MILRTFAFLGARRDAERLGALVLEAAMAHHGPDVVEKAVGDANLRVFKVWV